MTSRERILAAIRGAEVDYVPFITTWNESQRLHERLSWNNERERLKYAAGMGWDTYLTVGAQVTPLPEVTVESRVREENGARTLSQAWVTPAVTLHESLRLTDDWDKSELSGSYVHLFSDFRTPRYIEYPFKDGGDLEALEYIFPNEMGEDAERIAEDYTAKRRLADEFQVPLFAYLDAGMDWLMWLYPAEEQIIRTVDQPAYMARILGQINRAKHNRLELLLKLGVDGVLRRGWYETTDFWNPAIVRQLARPALQKEIELTHGAGKVYVYTIVTGIKPIVGHLASLDIDCLHGPDPIQGDMSVREIRDALPGKALWGGLSGPGDFGAASSEQVAKSVREVMSVYGKRRLILGMASSYRYYYSWENYEAAERAWKELR